MPITKIPQAGDSNTDNITVALERAALTYVPANSPVAISGLTQIQTPSPAAGEFYVDYQAGVLHFNAAQNGESLSVSYAVAQAGGVNVAKVNEIIDAVNAGISFAFQDIAFSGSFDPANGTVTPANTPRVILSAALFNNDNKDLVAAIPVVREAYAPYTNTSGEGYVYLNEDGGIVWNISGSPQVPGANMLLSVQYAY